MTELTQQITDIARRVEPKLHKPVVLVGMMGSGKSHVGSIIAKAMGLAHRDSDSLIERSQGLTIAEIFAAEGEARFREIERDTIEGLLQEGISVISTGGGCLTIPETAQAIRESGISVWLRAPVEVLYDRVKHSSHRPLIRGENPQGRLADLLAEREPLYGRADIVVDDPLEGAEALALATLRLLEGYLKP